MSRSTVLEALQTVLEVHDNARNLEREEGFPGMFEWDGSGELAALEALGYTIVPIELVEEEQPWLGPEYAEKMLP